MEAPKPQEPETSKETRNAKEWTKGALYKGTQNWAAGAVTLALTALAGYCSLQIPGRKVETGSIKPPDISAEAERKRAEAECIFTRDKETAVLTQQRSSTWADYQKCRNEQPFWVNKDEKCKPHVDRHMVFKRKYDETQARPCTAAKGPPP